MNANHEAQISEDRLRELEDIVFDTHQKALTRQHAQRQREESLRSKRLRLTLATPEVEVVTSRTSRGTFETMVNGGELDGERFTSKADPDRQHENVCTMARQMTST